MANKTYNFLNSGVNWLPLFTRTAVTGEPGFAGDLEYTFGTEVPTIYDGGFDSQEVPSSGIQQHWGQYDQAGIKRNHTGISYNEGDINPNINESSIFINNISPFNVKVWQYVGSTFSEEGQTSTGSGDENVGYWISHSNHVEPGTQQTIPWQNDQHGFQTERIYFQALDPTGILNGFSTSELNSIEEISIAQDYSAVTGNPGSVTADNIYGIMVMAQESSYISDLFNGNSMFSTLVLSASDDELEDSIGLIAGEFWKRDTEIFDTYFGPNGLNTAINLYREPNVTKAFIVIDTNLTDLENFVVVPNSITNASTYSIQQYTIPSSYVIDINGTTTTYNISASNVTGITMYYTLETSGVLSGTAEGSFLTGSVVQAKDINGVLMTATTNSVGYYEFPRPAFGEIVAKGGTNLMTGEEYADGPVGNDNVDSVQEDMVTNSIMGGTISPVSTLLIELQKNEGYSQEEALEVLVNEGQELYDLDSSIASGSKLKEYLKIGLTGFQNSETDDLEDYSKFLMFSKKIAEQEQLFVDTNISGSAQKSKKKAAANSYRKSLTRFIKRKQDGNVDQFKSDYLAKAGTDSTASAIGSTPTKKDQFYLVLADAVEKVDGILSTTDRLASSKADFKVKAKEMMEETIDDQESISTSGKDYEDIALEINEKFFKRKQAAKEEQVSRYNGNEKVNFSTRKSQNTFAITKENDGYKRSGEIIKKTGDSSTTLSSTAKTRTLFLKDDNVENFDSISVVGDTEVKLRKNNTGRLSGLSRYDNTQVSKQNSTGVEVKNPNHIIVQNTANSFSSFSGAYAFHASEGVNYKSKGLGNVLERYHFAIVDESTGKRVKANYANDSLFRQLADAFMTLANDDTLNDLASTVVYYYLNEFQLRRDTDMDGVIDSEDDFPNDPTKSSITPWLGTFRVGVSGTGNGSLTLKTWFNVLTNVDINWGDGSAVQTFSGSRPTHTYEVAGDYQVSFKFKGTEYWQSNNRSLVSSGDSYKLISIEQWGSYVWNTNTLWGEVTANVTATDVPTLTQNFSGFGKSNFTLSTAATTAWENIDLTPVRSMSSLFANCYTGVAQFGIDKWDTSQVTNMASTFSQRSPGDLVRNWNTSNVTSMSSMFASSAVGGDTVKTKVVNLGQANEYVAWDVSKVTNFYGFSSYGNVGAGTLDISNWQINTDTPVSMQNMFFRGGIPMEDLAKKTVTLENGTSYEAWNTSQVTSIRSMFYRASTGDFNINNTTWDTRNITDMQDFFFSYSGYGIPQQWDRDISGWDLSALTNKNLGLFNYNNANTAKFSTENYDAMLIAWNAAGYTGISANFGKSQYTPGGAAEAAKTSLASKGWTITDGGAAPRKFKMSVIIPAGSTNFTIPANSARINWGDGTTETVTSQTTHAYASSETDVTYTIEIDQFTGFNAVWNDWYKKSILQWGDIEWENNTWFASTSTGAMQWRIEAPAGTGNAPDLSNVTSLYSMFGSTNYKTDIGTGWFEDTNDNLEHWDVSTITNMSYMFRNPDPIATKESGAENLLKCGNWDVSNVTNFMYFMGGYSGSVRGSWSVQLNIDMEKWDTSSATNMSYMFWAHGKTKTGIENFITDNVTNFQYFYGGGTWDANTKMVNSILRWNVSNLEDFSNMSIYVGDDVEQFNANFPSNWKLSDNAEKNLNFYQFCGGNYLRTGAGPYRLTDLDAFATKTINEDWYGGSSYTAWDMANASSISNFGGSTFRGTPPQGQFRNYNISTWNISSKCTSFNNLFVAGRAVNSLSNPFDQDLSGWDVTGITGNQGLFMGGQENGTIPFTMSTTNYDKTLISWGNQSVKSGVTVAFGNSKYTSHGDAESKRQALLNAGWTITDGGAIMADTDGDGAKDDVDLYPNDNTKTTQEISGTLTFTDLGTFDSTSGIVGVSVIPFNLRQNLYYAENDASTPSSYKIYNGDDKDTADYITWDGNSIKNSDNTVNLTDEENVAYIQSAEFLTNVAFENYFAPIGGTGTASTDYVGSHYMWKSTNPESSTGDDGLYKVLNSTLLSATGAAPTATEAWEWGMKPVELWTNEFINFYSNNGFGEMNYIHAPQSRFRGNTDYTDISNQNLSTMTGSWIESLLQYSIMSVYSNTDLKNNVWSRGYVTYSEYSGARISGTYANPMLESLRRIAAHGVAEEDIIERDFVGPRGTEAYTNSTDISMTSTLQDIFTNQAAVDSWISTIGGAANAAALCIMYNMVIANGILEVAKNATDKANYENVMLNGYGNIDKMKQALSYSFINLPVQQNNYLHSYPSVAPFLNGGSLYKDLNARIAVEYISKFQFVVNWMLRVNDAVPASGGSYGGVVGDDNL